MKLVFGQDALISQWVASRIEYAARKPQPFGPCTAIGIMDKHGRALAGVVYHDYYPEFATMAVSMAAASPRWCQPAIVSAVLHYPFEQANVNVLWCAIRLDNARAIRFVKGLGFVQEGTLKHRFGWGKHAMVLCLEPRDYKRLLRRFEARQREKVAA